MTRGNDTRGAYRRAVITGASSGIGEAFARSLSDGTDLLLTGRNEAALEALADELSRDGRHIERLVADLAEDKGRDSLVAVSQAFAPDLLINNAGLGTFGRMIDNEPMSERAMVEVNVVAPTVITRALLPGMLQRAREDERRAGLVMIASTAAFQPLPYFATYAATKAFDYFYAQGLASELEYEPIDVLTVCPGPTKTRFFERAGNGKEPSGPRMSSATEVAHRALRALGQQDVVTIGAGNRAYRGIAKLLPERVLRGPTRRVLRSSMKGR
ncbi:SDR family NAD(P)-dependent oxidoreductase [Algihabitans albus]|uniref:SDR family NAD(P)-dependent oxidoreductase n=1 Tax=Algihabitans albus TaxID=2164067 RepID=UPI000E5CEF94|nr:SDR family NAD(P)-dependent oxidoreductase [Algihabitans albus]